MKNHILIIILFLIIPVGVYSQYITTAEYFIDSDPGIGLGISLNLTPGDSVYISDSISTVTMAPGMHYLNIRFKDSIGIWSHTKTRMFFKLNIPQGGILQDITHPIIAAEYFVDTDPGFGNGTAILINNPVDAINIIDSVTVNSLSPGMHYLNIRFKDSIGVWSHTKTRMFYKLNISQGTILQDVTHPIIAAEYFVDTDPGFGNGTLINFNPLDSINILDSISSEAIYPGMHYLNIRFKDSVGVWSHTKTRMFYKLNIPIGTILQEVSHPIIAGEYFIDVDPGLGKGKSITFNSPMDSVNVLDSIATTTIPAGKHFFNIRFKDSVGSWSHTQTRQFYVMNINSGLVAWYPFNGNSKDESGNGKNGTVYGSTLTTDRFGNTSSAYSFNGTSNYINIGGFGPFEEFTISAWIYDYGAKGDFQAIVSDISGGQFTHLQIEQCCIPVYTNLGYFYMGSIESSPYNTWRHIVLSASSGNTNLYQNLENISSSQETYSSITASNTVHIGNGALNGRFFNGKIDDIRIYNRALNVLEIAMLFNEGSLISPQNNAQCVSTLPNFLWHSMVNTTLYQFQLSFTNNFNNIVIDQSLTDTTLTPTVTLLNDKLYYWRVRSIQDNDTLFWSAPYCFSTTGTEPTYSVSGTLKYANTANTPISFATVYLKDAQGNFVSETKTNNLGTYQFQCVSNGTYSIKAEAPNKPWGGLNVQDAVLTRQKIAFLTTFTPLQNKAADVNLSNSVNVQDVVLMRQKIAFLNPLNWLISNYVFENPTIVVNGSNVTTDFFGLSAGDVNGSFVPQQ